MNLTKYLYVFILSIPVLGAYSQITFDSLKSTLPSLEEDTAIINLSLVYIDQAFYDEPKKCDSLLNEIYPLILSKDRYKLDRYLHYKCASNIQMGQADSAKHYGLLSLEYLKAGNDTMSLIRTNSNLGVAHEMMGRYEEAVTYYNSAKQWAEAKKDTLGIAIINNNIGLVYESRGNLVAAIKAFNLSLNAFKALGHLTGQSAVLTNFGKAAYSNGDNTLAAAYFNEGMAIDQKTGRKKSLSIKMDNLGSIFMESGELDTAEAYFNRSISIKEVMGDDRGIGISLSNISKILNQQGNYNESARIAEEALSKARKSKDTRTEAISLMEWGESEKQTGNTNSALRLFKEALKISSQSGELQPLQQAHQNLYELLKDQNPGQALYHLENAREYQDSLINRENIEKLTSLRLENEFREKELISEQEIALLNANNEVTLTKLSARNRIIGILVAAIALLGFLMYRLQLLRKRIKKTSDEKDTLLREIHHRVKNNLQVISALLTLQSSHLKDDQAKVALQEGQDRVQSMALIHKDLYQHDNLKGVNTKDYLEQLTNNLIDSYRLSENVSAVLNIQEIQLDVDTMIPMGLLVNELISNALKHAFRNGKNGQVEVSLNETDGVLRLVVKDNGQGVSDLDQIKKKSFGYSLVQSFARKLDADIIFRNDSGLTVQVDIKSYQKA